MQRESARPWLLDPTSKGRASRRFGRRGYAEIILVPNIPSLRTIHIHLRQCTIHRVTIADNVADLVLHDPFRNLGPTQPGDVHSFLEIKLKVFSALSDADEGELSIAIPSSSLPSLVPCRWLRKAMYRQG
jgi:hypothetical protein